jgi:predicted PurR-regulated permease PerM
VTRLHLVTYVHDHQQSLQDAIDRLSGSVPSIIQDVLSGLLAFVTIFVLAFFFLSQSRALGSFAMGSVPEQHRAAVRRVAADSARAVSGYMIGNLIISVFAGLSAFVCLLVLGVPNPAVIALWVAFADMIPLVGATVGAVVAVAAGFFESTPAGVISLFFFVVYQQVENNVIQPKVMARRVNVNPLAVLISVLLGVELFGLIGAVLAIPVAGAIQVAVREVLQERKLAKLVTPPGVELTEPEPTGSDEP